MAVSYLDQAFGEELFDQAPFLVGRWGRSKIELLLQMIRQGINSPLTSSCGRLFDGVAALIGLREAVAYEGQAAMELEMIQGRDAEAPYEVETVRSEGVYRLQPRSIVRGVVADLRGGMARERISRRFHLTVVEAFARICSELRTDTGLEKVVLGGGVFQNRTLLTEMAARLRQDGFQVFSKSLVPTNDGGISLGQAVAAHYMRREKGK
jgi:hydrogenase maturation protein HypF